MARIRITEERLRTIIQEEVKAQDAMQTIKREFEKMPVMQKVKAFKRITGIIMKKGKLVDKLKSLARELNNKELEKALEVASLDWKQVKKMLWTMAKDQLKNAATGGTL